MTIATDPNATKVLVTDFDGTMTRHDFYQLAVESLIPAETPDHWSRYRAGEITHFEALRAYFAAIRADEAAMSAVLTRMELDPAIPGALRALRDAGWEVMVVSAGCRWYIDRLFESAGIELEVHANPGHFAPRHGLAMEMPPIGEYRSPTLGVDKEAVVRACVDRNATVSFAGDGIPDADAARLVPERYRFARRDLAETLRGEGFGFREFARWSDIAGMLLEETS